MSPGADSQPRLTLGDLDRFLESPVDGEARQSLSAAIAAGIPDSTRYLNAAAVLAAFNPFQLKPVGSPSDGEGRGALLDLLLPLSEPIVDGPQRGLWFLSFSERRAALKRLRTRETMKQALAANPDRPDSSVQRMFERIMGKESIDFSSLSRDELAALIAVVDWTEGILDGLPDKAAVRSTLAKADLLAPMQRLAGHGFVNRVDQIEQLKEYVSGVEPSVPLFVFGTGGVGKSTLLAHFILKYVEPKRIPFVYIDIDRPRVRPDHPLTILLEAVVQLEVPPDLFFMKESLIKEIGFEFTRKEDHRQFDSQGYDNYRYFNLVGNILPVNQQVVFFLDTFEEAQYLGPDVVWNLLDFLFALARSLKGVRIILSGRALPSEYISRGFPNLLDKSHGAVYENKLPLEHILPFERPINLGMLDEGPARELLQGSIQSAGLPALHDDELEDVIRIVGRSPMCLKLAARLIRDEGIGRLREARSQFMVKLKSEKIQALLYGRILQHIHNEDVRKIAYPGLVVRRVAPDVIREVLAKPCGLKLTATRSEDDIFRDLSKEAALVEPDPTDGSLRHRSDVRRTMLEDLTDHVGADVVGKIDRAAVAFYAKHAGAVARAEEMYHRLRLCQRTKTLNDRWVPEAAIHLKGAGDELPARQRLWLAEKLGITLDESVRETASQEAWEDQAARTADRFLQSGAAEKALSVLHERSARRAHSRLYQLEAEACRFIGDLDEALHVSRVGVEELSKVGAVDMVLELLLKMVLIEETRSNLEAAVKLLDEARTVATHCNNEILRLRVQINRIRLHRLLRPEARDERAVLRREVLATLTDEMMQKLRSHPVLLREVAAELGKEDSRIAMAAIQTLGIEVETDKQAQSFANAIMTLNKEPISGSSDDTDLTRLVKQLQKTKLRPDLIRELVTRELTSADTRKLGRTLGLVEPMGDALGQFREYFRASVDSTLYRQKRGA